MMHQKCKKGVSVDEQNLMLESGLRENATNNFEK